MIERDIVTENIDIEKTSHLPGGKDFDINSIDDFYTKELVKDIEEKMSAYESEGGSKIKTNSSMAKFYIEDLPVETLGYHDESRVFYVKGAPNISKEDKEMGKFDGDTIYFDIKNIVQGDDPKLYIENEVKHNLMLNLSKDISSKIEEDDDLKMGLRFLGMDAPEIPKYSYDIFDKDFYKLMKNWVMRTLTPFEKEKADIYTNGKYELIPVIKKYKYGNIKNDHNKTLLHRDDDEEEVNTIEFKRNGPGEKNYYCEIIDINEDIGDNKVKITYVSSNESDRDTIKAGFKAQKLVKDLIESSYEENGKKYIHMILDRNSLSKNSKEFPSKYGLGLFDNGPIDILKRAWEHIIDGNYQRYKHTGFSMWGTDMYGRFLGAAYVKMQDKKNNEFYFINIAKFLIAHIPEIKVFPDFFGSPIYSDGTNFSSRIFNLGSYDFMGKVISESIGEIFPIYDDRKKIFTEMTKINPNALNDWTVIIGDTVLMIPPTSIRCITESTSEKFPVMRAKGSIQKGAMKSEKTLELKIFFNGEDGVNGRKYDQFLPIRKDGTSKKETYYMNGLRSLIAQFKFVPYLSIENRYINEILGIEGVSMDSIHISTVESYPKCLMAVLTLKEFNYRQYMPELPHSYHDDFTYFNAFSSSFNFPLMRWYYQRAIKKGNELRGVSPNSMTYIHKTHGNKTALIPMEFKNSYLNIYLADIDHLDRMLQVKLEKMNRPSSFIVLTDDEKELAGQISELYDTINKMVKGENKAYKDSEKKIIESLMENPVLLYTIYTSGEILQFYEQKDIKEEIIKKEMRNIFKEIENKIREINEKYGVEFTFVAEPSLILISKNLYVQFLKEQGITETTAGSIIRELGIKMREPRELIADKIVEGIDVQLKLKFEIQLNSNTKPLNKEFYSGLISEVSKDYDFDNPEDIFKDRKISVVFKINPNVSIEEREDSIPGRIIRDGDPYLEVDIDYDGAKFLMACKKINEEIEMQKELREIELERQGIIEANIGIDGETISEEKARMKNSIDIDDTESIKYNLFTSIEDEAQIRIKSMAVSYSNTYTRIGTSGSSGYASQYMGGQDMVIEVNIETELDLIVAALESLSKLSSDMTKEYRLIMPSSPLKIDCELSKFMGINEVLVENIMTETVEGIPGLYRVSIRFLSVDRTLRNREALQKIKILDPFHGQMKDTQLQEVKVKQFFEIEDSLRKAEVYPDLELPTVDELDETGFNYTQLSNKTGVLYPEPDFYFIYLNELASTIYKKIILATNSNDETHMLSDEGGGEVEYKATKENEVIKIESINSPVKNLLEKKEAMKMAVEQINDRKFETFELNRLNKNDDLGKPWDISREIKLYFMEDSWRAFSEKIKLDAPIEKKEEAIIEQKKEIIDLINSYLAEKPELRELDKYFFDINKSATKQEGIIRDKYKKYIKEVKKSNRYGLYNIIEKIMYGKKEVYSEENELPQAEIDKISMPSGRSIPSNYLKIVDTIESCADTMTASEEYRSKKSDWKKKPSPTIVKGLTQEEVDKNIDTEENKILLEIRYGIRFGQYEIKMYPWHKIRNITGKVPVERIVDKQTIKDRINNTMYLLDPYYRRPETTIFEIEEYKRNCIQNESFCKLAFLRNVLFAIKLMVENSIIPNIELTDVALTTSILNDKKSGSGEEEQIEQYIKFLENALIENGKGIFFTACLLVMTDFDPDILSALKDKKVDQLNQLVEMVDKNTASDINYTVENKNTYFTLRKFLLALVGNKVIDSIDSIANYGENAIRNNNITNMQLKYMAAAENPDIYIKDSFYDMIVNDKRGRMARAFPTFYMVFVDEGKEIGMWKLNDNFYNINSIYEIQVIKSRKIAADTARVVMSNIFHTFTTEDEDVNLDHRYDYRDVWNSLFNPRAMYVKAQASRLRQQPINRARITQGTRIHIRMGYGSNAASLPIVFNGAIAEVSAGEAVEIIAQGDGIELSNPMNLGARLSELDAASKDPVSKFFKNFADTGKTPQEIIETILNFEGKFIRRKIRELSNGYFAGEHPFGIYHFGSHKYTTIFENGEATQNIFEANAKPRWGDLNLTEGEEEMYNLEDVPVISSWIYDMSPWDAFNICKSVSPDFVLGIAPFGFRSTVFHGQPRFYYAYDYMRLNDQNNTIVEKRKPFQQYHIMTSDLDIISNNITVSSKDVKTNAVGYYTTKSGKSKVVGPLWVDWDIYPEDQKSMSYDTALNISGNWLTRLVKGIGEITWDFIKSTLEIDTSDPRETYIKKIAWRATANALKESVYEMYQGEMITIGSPSIKPHDRIFLHDNYEDMQGSFLVQGCVHNMSVLNGFTTTIYPDCIAVVDDRHELAIQTLGGTAAARAVMALAGMHIIGFLMKSKANPVLVYLLKSMKMPGMISSLIKSSKTLSAASTAAKNYAAKLATNNLIGRSLLTYAHQKGLITLSKPMTKASYNKVIHSASKLTAGTFKSKIVAVKGSIRVKSLQGALIRGGVGASKSSLMALGLVKLLAVAIPAGFIIAGVRGAYRAAARWAESLQVLQVFPLQKNKRAYVSGLNGSKGLIYGSPTYTEQGFMKAQYAKLLDSSEGLFNTFLSFMATDEMNEIARKYRSRFEDSEMNSRERIRMEIEESVLQRERERVNTISFLSMSLDKRIDIFEEDGINRAIKYYGNKNMKDIRLKSLSSSNNLVSIEEHIEPYKYIKFEDSSENKKFEVYRILHEEESADEKNGNVSRGEDFEIPLSNGKKLGTLLEANGTMIGIPILSIDAVNTLRGIVTTFMSMKRSNIVSINMTEDDQNILLIASATEVPAKENIEPNFSSTGYSFKLIEENSKGFLDKIIQDMEKEIDSLQQGNEIIENQKILVSSEKNPQDGSITIIVSPKEVEEE